MKQFRILILFLFACSELISVSGQTVIAFQGFEGTPSNNWPFIAPLQNNNAPIVPVGPGNYGAIYGVTGPGSIRVGGGSTTCGTGSANCINGAGSGGSCNNNQNGASVEFTAVNISCYTNVTFSVAHRTHVSCNGPGLDSGEQLFFETSLNGGPWTVTATINGFGDCVWDYNTNPVSCNGNPPVANPYVYNVPAGTQTVAFRVRIQKNRSDEVFYLDNATLIGTLIPLPPISIQHINP